MRISIIGGSNSVTKDSYSYILERDGYNINNKSIGATNSIYGIINILKYNLIEESDLLIFEYFVNDNNQYFLNINNVERVSETLITIISKCLIKRTKLIFILIYNKNDKLNNRYDNSLMFSTYKDIIKKYNIPNIDVYDLLYEKYEKKWYKYYRDETHLSKEGFILLSEEIKNKITNMPLLELKEENEYKNLDDDFYCIKIDKYIKNGDKSLKNIYNSIINLNYYEIDNKMELIFDSKCRIIGIEYICDNESGFIEVSNSINIIQKNTLKNEKFILTDNKQMASIITFNKLIFDLDDKYIIKIISKEDINNKYYDNERENTFISKKNKTNFKIVSIILNKKVSLLITL